nr:molybdopterin converting factor subunit 1 [Ameyamaea chiangmaiensis]
MSITVLYFASLRDRLGLDRERYALTSPDATVATVLDALAERHDALREAIGAGAVIRAAVNQQFATPATPVAAGDEVAFFPPVTGG